MADTYTTGLKNFITNNIKGGYITSTTTISTSDLNARINEIIGTTYAKIADLHNVATTGNYNQLVNRPNLATVATSGDYSDLINRPSYARVASTGSYNDLTDKPDLSARIQSELGDSVDEAILNVKNEILGQNVGANYNTLEKLQNRKAEVVYMDVTSNEYGSLTNFGNNSFNTTNHKLIDDIIEDFYLNKIIILQSDNGNFIVTNLLNKNNYTQISALKLSSNYNNLVTQFEIDNPESTFEEYTIANIKLIYDEIYIIYDKTKNLVFYIKKNSNFITNDDIEDIRTTLTNYSTTLSNLNTTNNNLTTSITSLFQTVDSLDSRIIALESYHSSTEPEPEEHTEP